MYNGLDSLRRQAARDASATRYMPTQRCRRGHLSERYTSTGGCIECLRRFAPAKPTLMQSLFELKTFVATEMDGQQRIDLGNYLLTCVAEFHKSIGLKCPMDPTAVYWAQANRKSISDYQG